MKLLLLASLILISPHFVVNPNHPDLLKIGESISFHKKDSTNKTLEFTLITDKKITISNSIKLDTVSWENSDGELYEDLDTIWINQWYFKSKNTNITLYGNNLDSLVITGKSFSKPTTYLKKSW